VLELIYHGDHIRCRLAVHGDNDFIVKVPNGAVKSQLEVGAATTVGWRTEDCRALDAA
jgi:putative spermidine/putrescine transport system ATP-binding protein